MTPPFIHQDCLAANISSSQSPKNIKAMKGIEFWILIAVGVGVVASVLTVIFTRHASKTDAGVAQIEEDGEYEGSMGGSFVSLAFLFSILAFLVIWLANAMAGRSIF
ncbi:MAG: hypothetical protein IKI10_01165 [Muribaculaceae bacterium]|nr:hypothetical protein [Muribaculaceae bacterium]